MLFFIPKLLRFCLRLNNDLQASSKPSAHSSNRQTFNIPEIASPSQNQNISHKWPLLNILPRSDLNDSIILSGVDLLSDNDFNNIESTNHNFWTPSSIKGTKIAVCPDLLTQARSSQAIVHSSLRQSNTPLNFFSTSTSNTNPFGNQKFSRLLSSEIFLPRSYRNLVPSTSLDRTSIDYSLCIERHNHGFILYSSPELPSFLQKNLNTNQNAQSLIFSSTWLDLDKTH